MHILIGFNVVIILVLVLLHENVNRQCWSAKPSVANGQFSTLPKIWNFNLSLVLLYSTHWREKDGPSFIKFHCLKRHFVVTFQITSKLLVGLRSQNENWSRFEVSRHGLKRDLAHLDGAILDYRLILSKVNLKSKEEFLKFQSSLVFRTRIRIGQNGPEVGASILDQIQWLEAISISTKPIPISKETRSRSKKRLRTLRTTLRTTLRLLVFWEILVLVFWRLVVFFKY